jgi:undecaprenyl-diphosphatase
MLESIKSFDQSLFLFLNDKHNGFFDPLMWLFSDKLFWVPLYAFFLWLLYKRYPKHYWTVLVAILLMIVVSDQLCNLSKISVMRLRPSHDPQLQPFVHILNGYRGGLYGFYSGHSSNAFSVALFMITSIGSKHRFIIAASLLFAFFTAYSRVYLGVHYPGDILVGGIIGTVLGTGFALFHKQLRERYLTSAS